MRVEPAVGPQALGCQGSACDRLRLTGGLRALALGSYIVSLRWRGTAPSAPFFISPLAAKTIQPPCGRGNAFPLWWLAPPPCPVGSMSLDSRVAYSSPMNPVPLPPPQFGGAAKGKRLNGQARRLTSPHLEVLCRTSTGDYKAPLCCELLMKGLLFRALFCPLHRGKSGEAG